MLPYSWSEHTAVLSDFYNCIFWILVVHCHSKALRGRRSWEWLSIFFPFPPSWPNPKPHTLGINSACLLPPPPHYFPTEILMTLAILTGTKLGQNPLLLIASAVRSLELTLALLVSLSESEFLSNTSSRIANTGWGEKKVPLLSSMQQNKRMHFSSLPLSQHFFPWKTFSEHKHQTLKILQCVWPYNKACRKQSPGVLLVPG